MTFDLSRSVLLPIDVQRGFDDPSWPPRWNAAMEANGRALLACWRAAGAPIVHVRHESVQPGSSLAPGHWGNDFRDGFAPLDGEPVVSKSVNFAFIGTDLDLRLRRLGAEGSSPSAFRPTCASRPRSGKKRWAIMASTTSTAETIDMAEFGRDLTRRREAAGNPEVPRNSGTRRTASRRGLLKAIEEAGGKW